MIRLLMILLLVDGLAIAQANLGVAILIPPDSKGIVDGGSLRSVQERIAALLSTRGFTSVAPIDEVSLLLEKNRISLASQCKDDCKAKLGKHFSAAYVVAPSLFKQADGILITLELVRLQDMKIVATSQALAQGEMSEPLALAVDALMGDSPSLAASKGLQISDRSKTLLEIGGTALMMGGLIWLGGSDRDARTGVSSASLDWNDNLTLP